MTYKPGSYLISDNQLLIFITDKLMLRFSGLSKPAIKGLSLSKVEFIQTGLGHTEVNPPSDEQILKTEPLP